MLPASPLLQLVPSRVATAIHRVGGQIWREVARVADIRATAAAPEHRSFTAAVREPLAAVKVPAHWGKLWDQRWFKLTLPVDTAKRADLFLAWDDQAEATVYVEGKPHYGFDVAHKQAPLPRGLRELWIEAVCCQTGIWHPAATGLDREGSRLTGASLVKRDEAHWGLYHDLLALDGLMREELRVYFGVEAGKFGGFGQRPVLNNVSPLLRRLLRGLEEGIDAYEVSGAAAARARLARLFRELSAAPTATRALLTGHAHIDLVWLWPEKVGEFKAVHSFATANRLYDRYPEFRFGYSQPASYEAVGRRAPALLGEVRKRIREKRWDATGGTEVESDTLLACGEALARSFLVGQKRFAELRGTPSRLLWLPDVFGYTPCLPQLMKETGVDYFYTTKLSWCALTRFPFSSFVWRGHDGTEVVSHITHEGGYNQEAKADQLRAGELAHRQSDVQAEFIAPTGFGDGGGGVTEEMCERARRYANLAGLPRAEWGNLEPFFDRLGAIRGKLPVYQGELYLEYHRGTYTTHGDIKAGMRRAERALQVHEAARCAIGGGPVPERPWQRVIFAQFHDYIPGSSIHEVYDEARVELAAVVRGALGGAAAELSAKGRGGPALFNPLPRPRVHVLGAGKDGTVEAVGLAPLSGGPVADLPRVAGLAPVRATAKRLDNGRVRADIDTQGRVSRLVVDGREVVLRAPLGELVIYADRPAMFEAWDIDRSALSLGQPVRAKAALKLERADAAGATIACTRSLGEAGEITVRYTLEAGARCLGVEVEVDWRRPEALLKMLFPTAYAGRQARYGAPFGSVLRSQVPGELADEAKWEVPASRWAAVMDETESDGLFVVTEAKYGFGCRDGVLNLSLLRSAAITCEGGDSHGKSSHPPSLRRTSAASKFSDMGKQRIALAIGRHDAGAPREEQAAALADTLFATPVGYRGTAVAAGLVAIEGGETLHPVWAKPAEAGEGAWVLRLNETLGRRGRAVVKLAPGWRARRVNLREQPVAGGVQAMREGVAVDYTPYALMSLLVERVRA
jgi:alpha-mannosidase